MKKKIVIVAFAFVGCGGAPFSSVGEPDPQDARPDVLSIEGGVHEGSVPDGADAHDSGGTESSDDAAGDVRDSTPESEAAPVESGPACCAAPTAACSYPLASCPIASENHGSFPSYFEVLMALSEDCSTVQTTDACLCDYTCGCIVPTYQCPAGAVSCTSDPIQGVLITCHQQ